MTAVAPSPGSSVGSCYGFEVRSSLPFEYLRLPGDGTALTVLEQDHHHDSSDEPVLEWMRRPGHELHAKVYVDGDRYRLWTDLEGWFHIDPSVPSISVPASGDQIRREERVWGVPMNLCYLERGDFGVHAAAAEVGGGALMFAAPGRFGKTTLAGAFLAAGHRLLSEDMSCCRVSPGPALLPGPAMLRVRRDVYDQFEFPGTYQVAEEPGRVHLAMEAGLRGASLPVPIRAVLLLRESGGDCRMERVPPDQVLPDLWALSFKLPTEADVTRCFGNLVSLAYAVPVWNVYRPLTVAVLPRVIDMIVTTCEG